MRLTIAILKRQIIKISLFDTLPIELIHVMTYIYKVKSILIFL